MENMHVLCKIIIRVLDNDFTVIFDRNTSLVLYILVQVGTKNCFVQGFNFQNYYFVNELRDSPT